MSQPLTAMTDDDIFGNEVSEPRIVEEIVASITPAAIHEELTEYLAQDEIDQKNAIIEKELWRDSVSIDESTRKLYDSVIEKLRSRKKTLYSRNFTSTIDLDAVAPTATEIATNGLKDQNSPPRNPFQESIYSLTNLRGNGAKQRNLLKQHLTLRKNKAGNKWYARELGYDNDVTYLEKVKKDDNIRKAMIQLSSSSSSSTETTTTTEEDEEEEESESSDDEDDSAVVIEPPVVVEAPQEEEEVIVSVATIIKEPPVAPLETASEYRKLILAEEAQFKSKSNLFEGEAAEEEEEVRIQGLGDFGFSILPPKPVTAIGDEGYAGPTEDDFKGIVDELPADDVGDDVAASAFASAQTEIDEHDDLKKMMDMVSSGNYVNSKGSSMTGARGQFDLNELVGDEKDDDDKKKKKRKSDDDDDEEEVMLMESLKKRNDDRNGLGNIDLEDTDDDDDDDEENDKMLQRRLTANELKLKTEELEMKRREKSFSHSANVRRVLRRIGDEPMDKISSLPADGITRQTIEMLSFSRNRSDGLGVSFDVDKDNSMMGLFGTNMMRTVSMTSSNMDSQTIISSQSSMGRNTPVGSANKTTKSLFAAVLSASQSKKNLSVASDSQSSHASAQLSSRTTPSISRQFVFK